MSSLSCLKCHLRDLTTSLFEPLLWLRAAIELAAIDDNDPGSSLQDSSIWSPAVLKIWGREEGSSCSVPGPGRSQTHRFFGSHRKSMEASLHREHSLVFGENWAFHRPYRTGSCNPLGRGLYLSCIKGSKAVSNLTDSISLSSEVWEQALMTSFRFSLVVKFYKAKKPWPCHPLCTALPTTDRV